MLFVTNRSFNEGKISPEPGETRTVTFDGENIEPGSAVFFCERTDANDYTEIGSLEFLRRLKEAPERQVLLYIHGFNNQPEEDIFPRAKALQDLCDSAGRGEIKVVPLIWPCDNDVGVIKDYWDDQESADQSAFAFTRVLGKFLDWRGKQGLEDDACYKRINVLAHSMGNRVLGRTLTRWTEVYGPVPRIFRNVFLFAADIPNEALEEGREGFQVSQSARNVAVYFAGDDLAMPASKVANLKNKIITARLGHTGPQNMERVGRNVFAVDCDDINSFYDTPKGHAYFLHAGGGVEPGAAFKHMFHALATGRVDADPTTRMRVLSRNYEPPAQG
ncbi:MAG: alpha/beta hydrolase [Magnetospirillum sp. WYHS-4]